MDSFVIDPSKTCFDREELERIASRAGFKYAGEGPEGVVFRDTSSLDAGIVGGRFAAVLNAIGGPDAFEPITARVAPDRLRACRVALWVQGYEEVREGPGGRPRGSVRFDVRRGEGREGSGEIPGDAREHTITLTNGWTGEQVTLPASETRAYGVSAMEPGAVRLIGAVSPAVPVGAVVLLKADGAWHHVRTAYGHRNHYFHFEYKPVRFDAETKEHVEDLPDPTEAHKETLARWFFRRAAPYGIPLGDSVMRWAFGESPPEEVAARYGHEPNPSA